MKKIMIPMANKIEENLSEGIPEQWQAIIFYPDKEYVHIAEDNIYYHPEHGTKEVCYVGCRNEEDALRMAKMCIADKRVQAAWNGKLI